MKKITIEWAGETYTIKESDAFAVGEMIEEIIPLTELAAMKDHPKFHKIARCYSVMINYAGGNTTPGYVHSAMMKEIKAADGTETQGLLAITALAILMEFLMDGAPEFDGDDGKKTKTPSL